MARKLRAPIPSVPLGSVKDGCIRIKNLVISYEDSIADDTTVVRIDGLAESTKPVSITIDFFLYNKPSDSNYLTHQAAGPTPLTSTARSVATGFVLAGKGKRPAYATLQLYEEWITEPLRPVLPRHGGGR